MFKVIVYAFISLNLLLAGCSSSTKKYDVRAIESLDLISETLGQINSCSFTLNTVVTKDNKTEVTKEHDVYLRGPDKMYIYTVGANERKEIWYDGKTFAQFIYGENVYDTISTGNDIISAIHDIHSKYGINFPASDFFYPTLTDDLIDNFDEIMLLNDEIINGVKCTTIQASREGKTIDIWIEKESNLPTKMRVKQTDKTKLDYEATFHNWRINPVLPDILFKFEPPTNSTRKKLQPKR